MYRECLFPTQAALLLPHINNFAFSFILFYLLRREENDLKIKHAVK